MYRLGNSQRLPRAMRALGKECINLLFQKEYTDLRVKSYEKFDGFNFDYLFENHQKRQNFLIQDFALYGMVVYLC